MSAPVSEFIPVARQKSPCATKNDALGWVVGGTWEYRRLRIGLRTNDLAVWPRLQSMLPAEAVPSDKGEVDLLMSLMVGKSSSRPGVKNFHLVYMAWQRMARTLNLEEALRSYDQALNSLIVSLTPGGTFFFFKAVRKGKKAVLLALEGREEDSRDLLTALAESGCEVLPDDYFEAQGDVVLKPFSSTETFEPVAIVMVERKPVRHWRPRMLTPGRASLCLVPFAPAWQYAAERVLVWLSRLTQAAPTYRGSWSDPAEVVRFVKRRLEKA